MRLDEATKLVLLVRRPFIFPNHAFMKQLFALERQVMGSSSHDGIIAKYVQLLHSGGSSS